MGKKVGRGHSPGLCLFQNLSGQGKICNKFFFFFFLKYCQENSWCFSEGLPVLGLFHSIFALSHCTPLDRQLNAY